jgi:hypothetical protein
MRSFDPTAHGLTRSQLMTHLYFVFHSLFAVEDFVAAKAHGFNRIQQEFNRGLQQLQQQSLLVYNNQRRSTVAGIWFGTTCSTQKSFAEVL